MKDKKKSSHAVFIYYHFACSSFQFEKWRNKVQMEWWWLSFAKPTSASSSLGILFSFIDMKKKKACCEWWAIFNVLLLLSHTETCTSIYYMSQFCSGIPGTYIVLHPPIFLHKCPVWTIGLKVTKGAAVAIDGMETVGSQIHYPLYLTLCPLFHFSIVKWSYKKVFLQYNLHQFSPLPHH